MFSVTTSVHLSWFGVHHVFVESDLPKVQVMRPAWSKSLALVLNNIIIVLILISIALTNAQQTRWPACPASASSAAGTLGSDGLQRIDLTAASTGCSLHIALDDDSLGSSGTAVRLAKESVIAGTRNAAVARPAAVQLTAASADSNTAQQQNTLLVPKGGTLVLRDVLLSDVILTNPAADPEQALRPAAAHVPAEITLHLVDTRILIRPEQLQQYLRLLQSDPETVTWTDNNTFLHIRSFESAATASRGGLQARHVTLLAQDAATVYNTSSTTSAPAAANDASGIATVTDSYILAANNATLVSLLQQLAGQVQSNAPLLVLLSSNITLDPAAGGQEWPPGGVKIKRPVIWVGSSWRNTSTDFHMEVGQFVLEGSSANVTLVNLVLENLAYGDELSARDAEGKSLIRSHLIWAFRYRRSQPRMVFWDCVMVFPEQLQIDSFIYWSDAFNSDLDFWRNQTAFMRNPLGIEVQTYVRGKLPGDYIVQIFKKDQRMNNVTYTIRPYVAPPLPLPIDPSLHSDLVTFRADPAVGPVYSREDVAVTLWNMRRSGCGRSLILLPTPDTENTVHWGPGPLDYSKETGPNATSTAVGASADAASHTSLQLQPLRAGQIPNLNSSIAANATAAAAGQSADRLSQQWPAPGGELVRCPVQFRGVSKTDQPNTEIDLGFVRGLFRLDQSLSGLSAPGGSPGSQAGPDQVSGQAAAAARGPVLQFGQLIFTHLPQGEGFGGVAAAVAAADDGTYVDAAPGAVETRSAGVVGSGSSSWSSIPAEAYTHLLWFVSRDLVGYEDIALGSVTLVVPPAEAAALQIAAAAAIAAAGGSSESAVLSMVYPSNVGPLPVVYRSLNVTQNPAALAAEYSTLFVGRRMHRRALREVTAAAVSPETLLCIGSMKGAGVSATNLCIVAQGSSDPLPPGYKWVASTSSSSSSLQWAGWKTALLVVFVVLPCLLMLWLANRWHKRRQQRLSAADKVLPTDCKAIDSDQPPVVGAAAASGANPRDKDSKDVLSAAARGSRSSFDSNSGQDTAGTCSSDSLKAYAVALAQKLKDCYSGSSGSMTDAAASMHGSAVGLAAAREAANAAAAAADAAADGALAANAQQASCVVDMGAHLGRVAAIHRSMLGHEDEVSYVVSDKNRGMLVLPQQQQQLGCRCSFEQPRGRPVSNDWQQQQQQQDTQMQRLSHAITKVSLEVHMRRLGAHGSGTNSGSLVASSSTSSGASSTVGSLQGGSRSKSPPPGAIVYSAPRAPRRGNLPRGPRRFASTNSVPRDVMRRRVQRMSIDEMNELVVDQPALAELEQLEKEGLARTSANARRRSLEHSSKSSSRTPTPSSSNSSLASLLQQQQLQQLQLHEVIGTGTFGVVYRATWRGIAAAVKVMQLPANAGLAAEGLGRAALPLKGIGGGADAGSRREQMAVMETALGSSLSHPNIVQVYTYLLRPLGQAQGRGSSDGSVATAGAAANLNSSSDASLADELAATALMKRSVGLQRASGSSSGSAVTGYELQLVMEYCPLGSLRAAIDNCLLEDRLTGRPQYLTVLSLALGVARAMHHMHSEGVLHGDLKAGNVLLKTELVSSAAASFSGWQCGYADVAPAREVLVSKVADFGLACRISDQDTHISGVHRGTLSHMSPELLVHGHASRPSDVYAMGILLWEMATGLKAFADIPKAMLGASVVRDKARPEWPSSSNFFDPLAAAAGGGASSTALHPPLEYRQLTEACWAHEPQDRPTFAEIIAALQELLTQEQRRQADIEAFTVQQQRYQQQQQQQQRSALKPSVHPVISTTDAEQTAACSAPATPAAAAADCVTSPKAQRTVTFADPPVSGSILTSSSSSSDEHSLPSRSPRSSRSSKKARAASAAAVAAVLGVQRPAQQSAGLAADAVAVGDMPAAAPGGLHSGRSAAESARSSSSSNAQDPAASPIQYQPMHMQQYMGQLAHAANPVAAAAAAAELLGLHQASAQVSSQQISNPISHHDSTPGNARSNAAAPAAGAAAGAGPLIAAMSSTRWHSCQMTFSTSLGSQLSASGITAVGDHSNSHCSSCQQHDRHDTACAPCAPAHTNTDGLVLNSADLAHDHAPVSVTAGSCVSNGFSNGHSDRAIQTGNSDVPSPQLGALLHAGSSQTAVGLVRDQNDSNSAAGIRLLQSKVNSVNSGYSCGGQRAAAAASPFGAVAQSPFDLLKDQSWG